MNNFIHLHLHSEYSLLDSSLKIPLLIEKTMSLNMPAVALTDHGNILGAIHFYKAAKKNDIKPIIGSELYVALTSRFSKPDKSKDESNYHHLVVLVKNQKGYRNLSSLITQSYLEGFYRKPRIDKQLLKKYHEGLIVLSACIKGEVAHHLIMGRDDRAVQAAKWFRELFKDDYYIEIQNHFLPDQVLVLPKIVSLAKNLSIPMVATNDVHYLNRDDSESREILICLQTNEVLSNPDRVMKKETDEMYFKSLEEMGSLFSGYGDSLANTLDVAAKCSFDFSLGRYFLPAFKTPDNLTIDDFFEQVCRQGFALLKETLEKKEHPHPLTDYEKRLSYEIEKIREMGFPGYFLIVWDIICFARQQGILVGPGRGSVVGSLVAYVMGITHLDPMDYDLIFERFLNPERISMPDIDIDFDGERRDEIIEYIKKKYGQDSVAQIVTIGRMKAKLAIRDIGRVLEIPLSDVNRLAKLISEGPKVKLKEEIESNHDLQKEIQHLPEAKKLIDFALKLENTVRHTGKHAAGVVIAPQELVEYMPLFKVKEDIVTHFEKDEVEEIGLLKMDILGLKTLTIIRNILSEIKSIEGLEVNLSEIPLNDKKTFKVFQNGDTDGIFQFESGGMREYLKRSRPDQFKDLIVLNALYRPGPLGSRMADSYVDRKLGKEKVQYILPELKDILAETYGIIVFQEQVMRISERIAGFSLSKADEMRKIMGKKLTYLLPAIETEFMNGAIKRNFDKKKVEELFSQMKTFAEYGFNKSHSAAYASLAYITAFLKAHYPIFFMAANLSAEAEKTSTSSNIIQYISECKRLGFEILPPDINRSHESFRVEGPNAIRFGLKGLKNVGEAAISSILSARSEGGLFKSLADFLCRIDLGKVNKAVLESLIKSGSLNCFGFKRRVLFESVENIIRQVASINKNGRQSQKSLFSDLNIGLTITIPPEFVSLDEWNDNEIIQNEKEVTGLYLTHNPLDHFVNDIKKVSNATIFQILTKEFKGDIVRLGGVITELKQRKSKKGDYYGEFYFEDMTGRMKVLAFKDRWEKLKNILRVDVPYFLEGRLPDHDDPNPNIYLENLTELELMLKKKARKILIKIQYHQLNDVFYQKLKEKLEKNKDSIPYLIIVANADGYKTMISSEDNREGLKPTFSMKRDIEKLTGDNTVEILY